MQNVSSTEDITESFWSSTAPEIQFPAEELSTGDSTLNRSSSEWMFQKIIHEISAVDLPPITVATRCSIREQIDDDDVVEIKKSQIQPSDLSTAVLIRSDESQTVLKRRLELECAAVAFAWGSSRNPQQSASLANHGLQTCNPIGMGAQSIGHVYGLSMAQDKADGGPVALPSLPATQKSTGVQVKSPTSGGSSIDASDDDEVEGDTETTTDMDPTDTKQDKRKLSNRLSARRSRSRKQAELTDLENKVAILRAEHSSLLKHLADANTKCNEANVNNRLLKANVETFRAKVSMAECSVMRMTGSNALLQTLCRTPSMPFVNNPVVPNLNPPYFNAAPTNAFPSLPSVPPVEQLLHNTNGNTMLVHTSSMQPTVGSVHSHKRTRIAPAPSAPSPYTDISGWDAGLSS